MSKNITYKKAMNELNKIIEEIQSSDLDIDNLSKQIARAQELISLCRAKLRTVESEVKNLENNEAGKDA